MMGLMDPTPKEMMDPKDLIPKEMMDPMDLREQETIVEKGMYWEQQEHLSQATPLVHRLLDWVLQYEDGG